MEDKKLSLKRRRATAVEIRGDASEAPEQGSRGLLYFNIFVFVFAALVTYMLFTSEPSVAFEWY